MLLKGEIVIKKVKTMAFDLGGVLAYQDLSALSNKEKFLLDVFMHRNAGLYSHELIEYSKGKIMPIYLKIHKLYPDTFSILEMLRDEKIRISIWTNNIKEIDNWMCNVGFYNFVKRDDVINSIYLGVDKPKKEFYINALRILKNSSKDIFFIDDNIENVRGALKCGIDSLTLDKEESLHKIVEDKIKRR